MNERHASSLQLLFSESLIWLYSLGAIIIFVLLLRCYVSIGAQEMGLLFTKNQFEKTLETGSYFVYPAPISKTIKIPLRTQTISLGESLTLLNGRNELVLLQDCTLSFRYNQDQKEALIDLFAHGKTYDLKSILKMTLNEVTSSMKNDILTIAAFEYNEKLISSLRGTITQLNIPIIIEKINATLTVPNDLLADFDRRNSANSEAQKRLTVSKKQVEYILNNAEIQANEIRQNAIKQSVERTREAKSNHDRFLLQLAQYEKQGELYKERLRNEALLRILKNVSSKTFIQETDPSELRLFIPKMKEEAR